MQTLIQSAAALVLTLVSAGGLPTNAVAANEQLQVLCTPTSELASSTPAADLVRRGLHLQAGGCGAERSGEAETFFVRGVAAPGDAEHQAWALRTLADLRSVDGKGFEDVESLLAVAQTRSQHYAWLHAEAWVRFRQTRHQEAARILEQLVSGRMHHTAWPWAMFYDDLGDAYAALGRLEDAKVQWRHALKVSSRAGVSANPRELPWDRQAVVRKLARLEVQ